MQQGSKLSVNGRRAPELHAAPGILSGYSRNFLGNATVSPSWS